MMNRESNRRATGWDSEYDDHLDDVPIDDDDRHDHDDNAEWGEWDEEHHMYADQYETDGGEGQPSGKGDMEVATDATEQSSTTSENGKGSTKWRRWILLFIAVAVIAGAAVGGAMAARSDTNEDMSQNIDNTNEVTSQNTDALQQQDDGLDDSTYTPTTFPPTPSPTGDENSGDLPSTTPRFDDEDLLDGDEPEISTKPRCAKKNHKPYALEVVNYSNEGAEAIQPSTTLTITWTGPEGGRGLVFQGFAKDIFDQSEAGNPIFLCLRSRLCYTAWLSEDMQDGIEWRVRRYFNEDKMIARGFQDQCDFIAPGRPDAICPITCV